MPENIESLVQVIINLVVVEDGCADRGPEVYQLWMEKVFPRQGTVASSKEMVEALAAL